MGEARHVAEEFVEAFNAHDEARIRGITRDDAVFEAPGEVKLTTGDAMTEYAMGWIHAFPDARIDVRNTIVGDGWAVQEFTFEGTHEDTLSGPGGEIPATHRHLSGRGTQIMRVDGGKIADVRLYFDQVDVMTQLGVMPAAASATA
ncbi:MAG TPA: ester cyclase [Gaiella sp.]|jgi:steroid delta-isomerase-like uncharacterized protein